MSELRKEMDWLTSSWPRLDRLDVSATFERIGVVDHCGDDIATISGLSGVELGGLIRIGEHGLALALSLERDVVNCVLLSPGSARR